MGKRSIEPYLRVQTVVLYQSDLNLSKISKQLQISRGYVRYTVTKFEEYAKFDNMKLSDRPKSLSDRNVHEFKRFIQGDNRLCVENNNLLEHESIQVHSASIFEEA